MRARLRVPSALVVVIVSAGGIAAITSSCGGEFEQCVRCLPDPQLGDAGTGDGPDAGACPPCLPEDGVCPVGCIPEGFT
jgi:hypothetical protein